MTLARRIGSEGPMRGIYAIVDVGTLEARGVAAVAFAEALLSAPLAALQLRAKDLGARETLALLRTLAPLCRERSVPLVANDRPDLAALAGADVVHVGQTDTPIELARRIAPGLDIGVSTHTLAEITAAVESAPAYVAFGPVFETATKPDAEPVVGLDGLRAAATITEAAGVPLVAIGGISDETIGDVARIADAVALISALLPKRTTAAIDASFYASVTGRAIELAERFERARAAPRAT